MPTRPITRHYNFGVTFRWIKGDSHIAVKRGYICEGRAAVVRFEPKHFKIIDRPGEDPHNDRESWIAAIPANPDRWDDDHYFRRIAHEWAAAHPELVNLRERTDMRFM